MPALALAYTLIVISFPAWVVGLLLTANLEHHAYPYSGEAVNQLLAGFLVAPTLCLGGALSVAIYHLRRTHDFRAVYAMVFAVALFPFFFFVSEMGFV